MGRLANKVLIVWMITQARTTTCIDMQINLSSEQTLAIVIRAAYAELTPYP